MIDSAAAVIAYVESRGVPGALIGGFALGAHGVARATLDVDVLVADSRVLDPSFWDEFSHPDPPEIRRGDDDDPLLGVARFSRDRPPVDIIVGRPWTAKVLARRIRIAVEGRSLPVVDLGDLALLKLFAAGPQDLLDVRILLAADSGGELRAAVECRLGEAPAAVGNLWRRIVNDAG